MEISNDYFSFGELSVEILKNQLNVIYTEFLELT